MPTLELQRPFETTEPRLRVESILLPGRHRFRLIVVDNDGIESDPVDTLVTIVGQVPSSDAIVRAREARGRVFYATGSGRGGGRVRAPRTRRAGSGRRL